MCADAGRGLLVRALSQEDMALLCLTTASFVAVRQQHTVRGMGVSRMGV